MAKKDDALAKADELLPQLTIEDVKERYAKGANDKEFALFLDQIKVNKLDPRKREVYFVKYGSNPGQIITGYQVYLQRAEATGRLNGWDVKTTTSTDGQIKSATITIYRKDWEQPFTWTVEASEFDKNQATWKQMKSFMLKKVCIAQAFRICFPDEVSGLPYTTEEITTFVDENTAVQAMSNQTRTIDVAEDDIKVDTPKVSAKKPGTHKTVGPIASVKSKTKKAETEKPAEESKDQEKKETSPKATVKAENSPTVDEAIIKKVVAAFSQFGVTEKDLEEVMGKDKITSMTESDREHLLAQYHKLKDSVITVEEFKASNN